MDKKEIRDVIDAVKEGQITTDEAVGRFEELPYKDLCFAKIDNHRQLRNGHPEVIYCEGKTVEQVVSIVSYMLTQDVNILGTRASEEMFLGVKAICEDATYNKMARTITIRRKELPEPDTYIAVVTAGTSDLPVAEEAVETAEILGNRVELISDVGVAGIHRLFDCMDTIRNARVVVVVAGMEGALASVVGGMVDKPVIAVPTSVGYGANFGGVSALLSMLNSCACGISVVNIDNGFGAGCLAGMINRL